MWYAKPTDGLAVLFKYADSEYRAILDAGSTVTSLNAVCYPAGSMPGVVARLLGLKSDLRRLSLFVKREKGVHIRPNSVNKKPWDNVDTLATRIR